MLCGLIVKLGHYVLCLPELGNWKVRLSNDEWEVDFVCGLINCLYTQGGFG